MGCGVRAVLGHERQARGAERVLAERARAGVVLGPSPVTPVFAGTESVSDTTWSVEHTF